MLFLGCSGEEQNPVGNSKVMQDGWEPWEPDRYLPFTTLGEASDQYVIQPPKVPVVEYEQYMLDGWDTIGYVKCTFDAHENMTLSMRYIVNTNIPEMDFYYYTYNADGTVAMLSRANMIDNSVNGNPQIYSDYGTTTYSYDEFGNITGYVFVKKSDTVATPVIYQLNDNFVRRIDAGDTCIFDAARILKELRTYRYQFIFSPEGLVTVSRQYFDTGRITLASTIELEYDASNNLTSRSTREPERNGRQSNFDSYYSYAFDTAGNWIMREKHVIHCNVEEGAIDTVKDEVETTYRNIWY